MLAGGVAANQRLREVLVRRVPVPVHIPDFAFCTDNAAMIAWAGVERFSAGGASDALSTSPRARWPLAETTP